MFPRISFFSRASRGVLLPALFVFALQNNSCSQNSTPETIALKFIEQVKTAVEDGSIRKMNELVSADYQDIHKRDRRDIVGLASAYLIRTKSLYLFTDLRSAQFVSDTLVQCNVLVAFAATPVDDKKLLPDINADFYWFDIELIKESGSWKVVSAVWQQAMIDDFFGDDHDDTS